MAITAVALSPENRTDALRRLGEEQFDILVIGAGVVIEIDALQGRGRWPETIPLRALLHC